MAKIIKVGSQNPTFTSQKTKKSSTIQTFRNSNQATNPFKFTNFEGNTLQFADVFEGFNTTAVKTNKLRMVAASVTGSMNKLKSGFESIVNFVNRVRGGFTSAIEYAKNSWEYARTTNIEDVPAIKAITSAAHENMMAIKGHMPSFKGISDSMTNMTSGITSKMGYLNKDVVEVGKDIKAQWDALIAKIPTRTHYTSTMAVSELEAAWRNEIELGGVA